MLAQLCVAMAPVPAFAHGTPAPTAITFEATATPHSFFSGSRATIENVCGIKVGRPHDRYLEVLAAVGDTIMVCSPHEETWLENMRDHGQRVYMSSAAPYLYQTPGWQPMREYTRLAAGSGLSVTHMEHRLLVDCLRRQDPDDAERILVTHIRRTRLELEKHPEIFSA